MTEPMTVNVGLIVPNTGDLVDLWGADATNPDFVAIDGLFAGVQTITVSNAPVTLTAPAGFTPTPGGGPTQSQNRVLRFTGVLTANVAVTLPLPGSYIVENLTTGNFVLSFQGETATEVIGTPQGERIEIYNDGANVRFVGLGRTGSMELWAGLSAVPAWVSACTVKPYLLCDNATYNFSDYPALSARLQGTFGGNGITTFGVPDLRGRVPLAYDGTGTRITAAGCGLNGQTLGGAIDTQLQTLNATQIPTITSNISVGQVTVFGQLFSLPGTAGPANAVDALVNSGGGGTTSATYNVTTQTGTSNNTQGLSHPNVQPSIVTGIWVIKT